jgi:lysozyme
MSVAQDHPKKVSAAAVLAAVALVSGLLKTEEGYRPVGYLDIVHVPTYCYGGTGPNAIIGKRYSADECNTQLAQDARRHAEGIAACIHVDTPPASLGAFVSFSYNVGIGGFCHGSVARDLNAGHLAAACADLSKYVFAGGHPVQGLVNRRAQERALCEKGLTR